MSEPFTVNYTPTRDDWVDWTVTVCGRGKLATGRAPTIIAARHRAEQLLRTITCDERVVTIHLIDGDPVAFTSTYLTARHGYTSARPAE